MISFSFPFQSDLTRRRLSLALGLTAGGPLWLGSLAAQAATLPPLPRYTQPVRAHSPLVGRILQGGQQFITPQQLLSNCAQVALCLLGEQHDHPDHHAVQAWIITALAQRGKLAAVALEMADAGRRYDGPRAAPEAVVRERLHWNEAGWPWAMYAAPVMAAVRAGVPVAGVNLPRADMRAAMRQSLWDASVSPAVRQRILDDVAESHCGLLPASQLPAMVRVQLARDDSMAAHGLALMRPGKTVVLLTGSFHADRNLGVALHLAAHVEQTPPGVPRPLKVFSLLLQGLAPDTQAELAAGYDAVWFTPGTPPIDHCAQLRLRMKGPARP
ncbi:MAG: ChaN family lipoprotein [Thiomonas sp.]|uniref:ChaN family lipoprotein n=1 Tax=Thiomonas sp. TaxID=2047785 RepID=UPI002A36E43F|nr:ChaN family lipoprotein [Thiomonas sp.]MDY0329291.1 ChaN family lipoprotein [Thiomonas sp.]